MCGFHFPKVQLRFSTLLVLNYTKYLWVENLIFTMLVITKGQLFTHWQHKPQCCSDLAVYSIALTCLCIVKLEAQKKCVTKPTAHKFHGRHTNHRTTAMDNRESNRICSKSVVHLHYNTASMSSTGSAAWPIVVSKCRWEWCPTEENGE